MSGGPVGLQCKTQHVESLAGLIFLTGRSALLSFNFWASATVRWPILMQQKIQRCGGLSCFKGLYQLLLFGIQVVELEHSILDLGRQKTAFRVMVLRPPELVAQTRLAFLVLL